MDPSGDGFDGITKGYQLIEEHIRRARAAVAGADKPRKRKQAGFNDDDVRTVVAEIFRSLSELLPMLGDVINRIGAEGITRLLTSASNAAGGAPAIGITPASSRVKIEISSKRPASANLELRTGAEKLKLSVHPLIRKHSGDGALKSLTFSSPKRRIRSLRIDIPVQQAPGTYTGVVVDSQSGEAQGVLTVYVHK
jgi:hypothetical protein